MSNLMTDTTDIKALRNKFGNKLPTPEQARERFTELLSSPHGTSWFLAPHAIALLDALEAERQRADEAVKVKDNDEQTALYWAKIAAEALAEIAALKGGQVPVALVDERQGSGGFCLTQHGRRLNLPHGTELFTGPQKPVVPVGFLFVVEATGAVIYSIADAAIEGTQLIGKIYGDAAIEAAGGVVKDGD